MDKNLPNDKLAMFWSFPGDWEDKGQTILVVILKIREGFGVYTRWRSGPMQFVTLCDVASFFHRNWSKKIISETASQNIDDLFQYKHE